MDKTYQTDLRRTFLINGLPEPLTPATSHLQIFDNYIENTRLRLRSIRIPEEKSWTWILEQRFSLKKEDLSVWKTSQIFLNEAEYKSLEGFKGREIRKNRYFYNLEEQQAELDIYLGKLWGLNLMNVHFEGLEELNNFELPPFVVFEVTNYQYFTGENLVNNDFEAVREEYAKIQNQAAQK